MPRGDGTGPIGSGRMTGRGMGPCSGSGKGGFFSRKGRGLGLLGLGMWLVRLWGAGKQITDVGPVAKNDDATELKRTRNR
jgi:hypothetical protein